jgi:catalase
MTARFSMGGGNPGISDKTKPTTRGFAMDFEDRLVR